MSSVPAGSSSSGLGLAALVIAGTCVSMSVSFAPIPIISQHHARPTPRSSQVPTCTKACFGGPSGTTTRSYAGNGSACGAASSDDFDPLLSPHEYPAGIDAGAATPTNGAARTSSSTSNSAAANDDDSFDPFLTSPHDFPSAMSPENAAPSGGGGSFGFDVPPPTGNNNGSTGDDANDDDWSPLRGAMNVEKFADDEGGSSISAGSKAQLLSNWAVPSATSSVPADAHRQKQRAAEASASASASSSTGAGGGGDPDADLFDVFNPRLSPHVYA